ncbi:hypothetical protein L3Q82_022486, partial [Scortum barcoo]
SSSNLLGLTRPRKRKTDADGEGPSRKRKRSSDQKETEEQRTQDLSAEAQREAESNSSRTQESAASSKDGRTKATKRKASPDKTTPTKRTKVCEKGQNLFEEDLRIGLLKRKIREAGEGPSNPKKKRKRGETDDSSPSSSTGADSDSSSNLLGRTRPRKRKTDADGEGPSRKRKRSSDQKETEEQRTQDLSAEAQRVIYLCFKAEFEAKYVQQEELGEGGCGSVFAGYRKADRLPVAIKHIPRNKIFCKQVDNDGREISMEVAIMMKLAEGSTGSAATSAPVSLLDWYDLDFKLILVLERPVPSEDLYSYIEVHGGSLQENKAKIILKQLVEAALELQDKCIFHRDIKVENILIETSSDVPRVRLIDFGLSCFVKETSFFRVFYGTSAHIPPEYYSSSTYRAGPSTVWQLGVVLFDSLHRKKSFNTTRYLRRKLRINNKLSKNAREAQDYRTSHIITAKNIKMDSGGTFLLPEAVEVDSMQHLVVYDSNTSSLEERGRALECAQVLAKASLYPVHIVRGGFQRFSALYPFLRTEKIIYTIMELENLKTYPVEIIAGLLYLGDQTQGLDSSILKDLKISAVVSISESDSLESIKRNQTILQIPVADSVVSDLYSSFEKICTFIGSHINMRSRVLIVSGQGTSRCSATSIAFLMHHLNYTLEASGGQSKMLFSPTGLTECLREWEDLKKNYQQIQDTHRQYKQKLEEVTKLQDNCSSAIARQRKRLKELTASLEECKENHPTPKLSSDDVDAIAEIQESIKDRTNAFFEMEAFLPKKNGLYLNLVLGNVNVTLLNKQSKFAYKDEYEKFKLVLTVILFVFSFTCRFVFSYRALDALFNFLLVWYYCTLTIRESILISNGSRIKGWWVFHHYVSTFLSGVMLTWPEGALYQMFRNQFLTYCLYQIGFVQFLQYYYQSGCLYRLRALGERHTMDLTVEGFQSWMWRGLTFLLPFLFFGHFWQLYNSITLFRMFQLPECKEWQVAMCGCSYMALFMGNFFTTLGVVYQKYMNNQDKSKSL